MSIQIPKGDIEVLGSAVKIRNHQLVNHLIENQHQAVAVLSTASPISVKDLHVDTTGAVIIDNQAYAVAMKNALSTLPANSVMDNGACGAGC
jgi:hypothetical protein